MQFKKGRPNLNANPVLPPRTRPGGFTLIELLVVIAIIAILAAVLLPVLNQAKLRGEAATCIDHQKQLATAWIMYAGDNNDYCAGNFWTSEQEWTFFKGKFSKTGAIGCPTNWMSGWIDPSGASGNQYAAAAIPPGESEESDNTNWDLLVDPSYASLGDYTKNAALYICPAYDVKVEPYGSGSSPSYPKTATAARSVSMNCWVGYVCNPPAEAGFKMFNKTTAITAGMSPVDLFVFMEERAESIDDGSFEVQEGTASGTTWTPGMNMANWPTDYHNQGAALGFADGHVEIHRWMGTPNAANNGWTTTAPQEDIVSEKWGVVGYSGSTPPTDLMWLETHATCLTQ